MEQPTSARTPIEPSEGGPLSWQSHAWAEDSPARRAALVALVVAASALAAYALDALWAGFASLGFLFGSLSRYFVPVVYVMDTDGVRVRHFGVGRFYPWSRFRRAALRREGVFLGTFDRPRRLDVWRGCYLRCPDRRTMVYAYARAHILVGPTAESDSPCSGDAASARADA